MKWNEGPVEISVANDGTFFACHGDLEFRASTLSDIRKQIQEEMKSSAKDSKVCLNVKQMPIVHEASRDTARCRYCNGRGFYVFSGGQIVCGDTNCLVSHIQYLENTLAQLGSMVRASEFREDMGK